MKLKNLLTGILLAGSALAYGQAPNDNYKKISELYGKRGERITYKDYSKIPLEQIDSNKIIIGKIFTDEDEFDLKVSEENKTAFEDTVFAEAYKLGYKKGDIQNLESKEAIELAVNIVASRYEYDYSCMNEYGGDDCDSDSKSYDYSFFRKLGICVDYSRAFVGVFDLIKKENKNLNNIYTTTMSGLGHMWNELIFLTKDSMLISDIDITSYDKSLGKGMLERKVSFNDKGHSELRVLRRIEYFKSNKE